MTPELSIIQTGIIMVAVGLTFAPPKVIIGIWFGWRAIFEEAGGAIVPETVTGLGSDKERSKSLLERNLWFCGYLNVSRSASDTLRPFWLLSVSGGKFSFASDACGGTNETIIE